MAARRAATVGGVRGAKIALGLRRGAPGDLAYFASRTVFGARQVSELAGLGPGPNEAAPREMSVLQQVSWHELTGYMRNTLLRDSDVFSMVHGLELRVPFVDREVVAAAFGVADSLKLSRGMTKPLLVDATSDLLPPEVWDRPKQGFVLPFAAWMQGPLAADVGATLGDAERVAAVGLDPRAVGEVWSTFLRGQAGLTWSRPWALYALVRWGAEHGIGETPVREPYAAEAAAP
jgi:asparagine synthetase B (glutamine-hydrolysing)